MPNVGWGEMLLILLVALLVFGPKRLPEMMRSVGKALRAFQEESSRAAEQLRAAVDVPATEGVTDRPDGVIDRPDVQAPTAASPRDETDFHEDT